MGKKVAGWTPPETDVIVESNGNGWTPPPTDEVIEEQPKKKESTSPAGDASVTPVEQPSQPSEQPTVSEQPTSDERTDRLIRFAQNEFDTWQKQRLAQIQAEVDAGRNRYNELNKQFRKEQEAKLTEINKTAQNEFDAWQKQRLAQIQAEVDADRNRYDELNKQFRKEQEAKLTEINKTAQNEFDTWQKQRLAQIQAVMDANRNRYDELNEQFRKEQEAKLTEINETVSRFTTEALKRQKLDIQRKVIEADTAARTRELVEKGGVVNTLKAALNELRGSLRAPADENAPEDPFANALKRGSLSAQLAEIVNPFAGKLTKEDAKAVADLQKEISGLSVSEEYDAFSRAKTFREAVNALSKDPVKIITELTVESMSALATYGATRIAAGVATGAAVGSVVPGGGTAAGAGYGAIAGLGASSYALEYSNKYLETMRELGVDITSAESLEKAFNDPAIVAKARAKANQKGIPIMIFDMISGGIAGKIVTRPAAGIVRKIAGGAAELGVQAVLGGAGDAAGQWASGERLSPSDIIAEMVAEFGLAPVEITTGALTFNAPVSQTIADQVQKVDPNNPASIKQAAQTVKQTINQNATPLREDTGSVPQQGGQPEGSQAQGGDDIQQPAPEISQLAPAGQPAQEQIQPQAEGQGLQVAPNTYSVSITPATIRKFDDLTAALKEKSDRYNALDKQMMDNAESMTDEEFAALQAQRDAIGKEILDQGRAMLQPEIEAIEGVKIQRFGDLKGRWDGRSEPSFDLTVTAPESSLPQLRLKLAAFAEKTSQDAFFVTKPLSSSDQRQMAQVDLINGTTPSGGVSMPLARLLPPRSLSEREKSIVSGILERNGIKDYSVNKDGSVDVMYFDDKRNEQSTNDEIRGRYQEFRTKLETAAAEIHRRGLLSGIGRGFKESWASFSDNAYSGDQRRSYTGVRNQILQGQAQITTPDEGKTQTQTTPPSSSGVLTGPPSPPAGTTTSPPTSQPGARQTALTDSQQLLTGKEKPSSYYTRMVEDETIGDAVRNLQPTYQEQSLKKAISISNTLVDEAIAKNDVDNLYKETVSNFNRIPPLMQVNLTERLIDYYAGKFDDTKVKQLYDLVGAEAAAERGRAVAAYNTGRGEPQRKVAAILADHATQKTRALTPEVEEKLKKLHQELRIKDEELVALKKKLEQKISEVEKNLSGSERALKKRIIQRSKKVAAAKKKLEALKISTKGQANSITQVIGATAWNAAIDTINVSLDAGLSLANAIDKAIVTVKQHYSGNWDTDAFRQLIRSEVGSDIEGVSDVESAIKKGIDINSLIDSHYTEVENAGKSLSDRLVEELGLDKSSAVRLEKDIQNTLRSIVSQRQTEVLAKRLGSEKIPVKPKKRKDLFEQIITDINRGALSDDLFTDLFAEYYGFQKLTPQARRMLLDYADKMQRLAPYPEMYNRVANQFWNDLKKAGIDSATINSVYLDFLYHSALSGLTTQSRSLKGSTMTNITSIFTTSLATPQAALKAWRQWFKGLPAGLKTAVDIMRTGYRADIYSDFRQNGDSYITRKINTPMGELIKDRDWGGVLTKIHMTIPAYLLRALSAWDAILKYGNRRFHGYMIEYNQQFAPGTSKEANSLYTKDVDARLRQQALEDVKHLTDEGMEIPPGYVERRIEELRESMLSDVVRKRIYQRSDESVLMSDPHGMAGSFYRWMQNNLRETENDGKIMAGLKMFGRTVFLIMRVPANFINMNIDYSPLGYIRAARGTLKYRDGVYTMTPEERRIAFIKATSGTSVAVAASMMLFDWDDEDGIVLDKDAPIRIYGPGTNNWAENESIAPGFKPWSIQFKGKGGQWSDFYTFIDNPFGAVLAPLAIMSDNIRFKEFQKKVDKREYEIPDHTWQYYGSLIANGAVGFLMSQSYQQGMRDMRDILLPYNNDYTKSGEKLEKLVTRPVRTITIPNIYQQLYNYAKAGLSNPEKYAKSTIDKMVKGTPIIESVMLDDDVDMFGYPVIRRFEVPLVPDVLIQRVKDNIDYREDIPEWQLVHKYPEVTVAPFKPPTRINKQKFKDEHIAEFKTLAGVEFRKSVKLRLRTLNNATPEELQAKLDKLRSDAYDKAVSKIKMKYYK